MSAATIASPIEASRTDPGSGSDLRPDRSGRPRLGGGGAIGSALAAGLAGAGARVAIGEIDQELADAAAEGSGRPERRASRSPPT
jgi:hypothetical protein